MNETIAYIFILVGVLFDLFGSIGIVRLPDVYNRLQAATKSVTLGTCLILIGVLIHQGANNLGMKALICTVFVLMTSPVGAHAIARGAHVSGVKLWGKSLIDKFADDKRDKQIGE